MILSINIVMCLLLISNSLKQTPIIGIYTQDYNGTHSYIAGSYVKYLEMSGAQVVPLFYTSTTQQLTKTLNSINGVLIPGGDQNININNRLTQNADSILKYSIQEYHNGRIFPIWGTCAGHGLLGYLTSKYNINTRQPIQNAAGIMNSLQFKLSGSKVFKNLPQSVLNATSTSPGILYFFQHWAIYQDFFQTNNDLNQFWDVITVSNSSSGRRYITSMQAKLFPIFTVQFHPQKSNYEWQIQANRTQDAIVISQTLSNNFVEFSRLNNNSYSNENQMRSSLIYNYICQHPRSEDYNMFTQVCIFEQPFRQ